MHRRFKVKNMKKPVIVFSFMIILIMSLAFQKKPKVDLASSTARGKELYQKNCMSCHMEQGEGMEGIFPPLAKSDYLLADKKRAIQQTLYGVSGEMTVNGKLYNGEMAAFNLSDEEMSDLMNYIFNSFGNKNKAISPDEIKAVRRK